MPIKKAPSAAADGAFKPWHRQYFYFPLNCAFLFSRKAVVPSFLSSVMKHSPNASTSRVKPPAPIPPPPLPPVPDSERLAHSMHLPTAIGALLLISCSSDLVLLISS